MRWLLLCVAVATAGSASSAQGFKLLGDFDNVRQSNATGDSHCYGYSLTLWQSGQQVLGLFNIHEGLCGDPACGALTDVSFEPKTGRLRFRASESEFIGTLRRDDVLGTVNGRRVRLKRNRERDETDWDRDRSLDAWCDFWTSVHRCTGVAELCTSLRGADVASRVRAR